MTSDSKVYQVRWGIIGAGVISAKFVDDLNLDPKTRGVHDVNHTVVAVASRDLSRAQGFINENCSSYAGKVKAYGTYEEIVADPNVDVIYIGTPHTHHYANTKLALTAHKHVLCEKPFTSNAAELQSLIEISKLNNVFLMEALWTRFLPISVEIKKFIESEELGEIQTVHADLSADFGIEKLPHTHRILDPNLGGGSILDLGPYPMIWAIMCLYEHPRNQLRYPDHISGAMLKTPLTGVDASAAWTLTFNQLHAQAILSTSIRGTGMNPTAVIRFRRGRILVAYPPYCPREYTVQYLEGGKVTKEDTRKLDWEGGGWHFQADEVARCIRDGKLESDIWTLEKSTVIMKIFDEVRKQGDYKFPPGIEQVV